MRRHDAPFALALACCAWPPSEAAASAVRERTSGIDWTAFARLLARHRIEGLAWDALARAGVAVPEPIANDLRRRAAQIALAGLAQAASAVRLQKALDAAGIANLALKGPALEVLAFGRLGFKSAWDIDLLVDPPDVGRAALAMAGAGYALADPPGLTLDGLEAWTSLAKECAFVARDGVVAELHWRPTDNPRLLPGIGAVGPHRSVALPGGPCLRTLPAAETFAYLCVHGAAHGWSRLKWLADLAALLSHETPEAIAALHDEAVALGGGVCPALALRLCQRLFGLALPPDLSRRIGADPKVRWLDALAMAAMTGGGGAEIAERPLAGDRILASHLLFADGWAWRRAEFRRQWTSLHDRRALRLPGWLYSVIRIPSWIARRAARLVRP
ncbi:MAG: nucleotidyltransferase family protein [Caulobacteraceae bacterium]